MVGSHLSARLSCLALPVAGGTTTAPAVAVIGIARAGSLAWPLPLDCPSLLNPLSALCSPTCDAVALCPSDLRSRGDSVFLGRSLLVSLLAPCRGADGPLPSSLRRSCPFALPDRVSSVCDSPGFRWAPVGSVLDFLVGGWFSSLSVSLDRRRTRVACPAAFVGMHDSPTCCLSCSSRTPDLLDPSPAG